jgi:DNA-binding CsgD family transcriptional regulator
LSGFTKTSLRHPRQGFPDAVVKGLFSGVLFPNERKAILDFFYKEPTVQAAYLFLEEGKGDKGKRNKTEGGDFMESTPDMPCPDASKVIEERARTVFDALSAHIAIVDEAGVIIETNKAWRDYGRENGMAAGYDALGENYLAVCDQTRGEERESARRIAEGIRRVISGEIREFRHDYPCHTPTMQHWFYLRATGIAGSAPLRAIISHEDITELKLAEAALRQSREESETHRQQLEETNIALKVLLKQRETDKVELEKKVLANIKELVLPYLNKLKNYPLPAREKTLLGIVFDHLNDIISPLMQKITTANIFLTPQELQVAALVKDGKSTQEIADILFLSVATVSFHRKNLRKKFGLNNKPGNLRSHLIAISNQ